MRSDRLKNDHRSWSLLHPAPGLVLLTCLVFGSGHAVAQDDYLMELEGDLDGMAFIDPVEPATSGPDSTGEPSTSMQQEEFLDQIGSEIEGMSGPSGGAGLVPENAQAQFDSDLKERMPGTFVLYKRLGKDKKALVFDEYQNSGDYLRVRRTIIDLRRMK